MIIYPFTLIHFVIIILGEQVFQNVHEKHMIS